jgi:hypothetical protein
LNSKELDEKIVIETLIHMSNDQNINSQKNKPDLVVTCLLDEIAVSPQTKFNSQLIQTGLIFDDNFLLSKKEKKTNKLIIFTKNLYNFTITEYTKEQLEEIKKKKLDSLLENQKKEDIELIFKFLGYDPEKYKIRYTSKFNLIEWRQYLLHILDVALDLPVGTTTFSILDVFYNNGNLAKDFQVFLINLLVFEFFHFFF